MHTPTSIPGAKAARLKRMLTPASVAFVGGGILAPAIDYCRARGFAGPIATVNPTRREIAGIACVPTVADLSEVPDAAFVAVPKEVAVETIAELAALGTGGAACNTSGFSETDPDGAARQASFVDAAGVMPVLGPNTPGFANFLDRTALMMSHFGDHEPDRGVAFISNGGAYLSDVGCADRSVPAAYLVGMGNQAMVSVADILDAVLDDPRVTAVNLYFEGLVDIPGLSRAALKAARNGIPVVAVKGGRSTAGFRATRSHTASLSGDAEVAGALFRRFGWIECTTPTEALETLKMLTVTPLPRGNRAAFVTSSGSYAVLGADAADLAGLTLPLPDASVAAKVEAMLPPFVKAANPLDISTAHSDDIDRQHGIYAAFLEGDADLALQVMCYPPVGGWGRSSWDATTTAFSRAAGAKGLPRAFINTLPEAMPRDARERLIAEGVAPLLGLEDGMRAVGHTVRYGIARDGLAAVHDGPMLLERCAALSLDHPVRHDEAAAKALIAAAGVPVPAGVIVGPGDAMPALNWPVAVKALSPNFAHKTEIGAVTLGLNSKSKVKSAIRNMAARLSRTGHPAERFLVEEMVADPIGELLVGIRRLPGIGFALTLAIGGTAVELTRDAATVLLPASRETIETALRGLRMFPLLDGWRGAPRADLAAALDAVQAVCGLVDARRDRLIELEVNPLILTRDGAIAADAVLVEGEPDPANGETS